MSVPRVQVNKDKTRLAVAIPSETYVRLSARCGRRLGEFVDRAINAELERDQEIAAAQ